MTDFLIIIAAGTITIIVVFVLAVIGFVRLAARDRATADTMRRDPRVAEAIMRAHGAVTIDTEIVSDTQPIPTTRDRRSWESTTAVTKTNTEGGTKILRSWHVS